MPRSKDCISIHLQEVEVVDKLKILGVTFNRYVSWCDLVSAIAKSASRRLFPLRLLRPHVDDSCLKKIYYGIMRSIIEYAAPLFVGLSKKESKKLDSLQKRFHKLLCGGSCSKECLPPLSDRRRQLAINLHRSAECDGHILKHVLCQKSSTGRLIIPTASTTRRLSSFSLWTALFINESFKR